MSSNDSAESDFIRAFVKNSKLRAKIEEEYLRQVQEIGERLKLLEMAWMKSAAKNGDERSGATGRLDKAALERARMQAGISRLEKNFMQFLIEFDTFRRETRRNESLLTQMWRAWRALREGKE